MGLLQSYPPDQRLPPLRRDHVQRHYLQATCTECHQHQFRFIDILCAATKPLYVPTVHRQMTEEKISKRTSAPRYSWTLFTMDLGNQLDKEVAPKQAATHLTFIQIIVATFDLQHTTACCRYDAVAFQFPLIVISVLFLVLWLHSLSASCYMCLSYIYAQLFCSSPQQQAVLHFHPPVFSARHRTIWLTPTKCSHFWRASLLYRPLSYFFLSQPPCLASRQPLYIWNLLNQSEPNETVVIYSETPCPPRFLAQPSYQRNEVLDVTLTTDFVPQIIVSAPVSYESTRS